MVFHAVQFVFGGNTKGFFMVQLYFVKIIEVPPNLLITVLMTNTRIIVKMLK